MRKLFPVIAAALMGVFSMGSAALPRRADSVLTGQPTGIPGKGKGKLPRAAKKSNRPWARGKHYPFSSTRQSRPKHRTAVVHGFPILQRMNRQQIADLYRSSVL